VPKARVTAAQADELLAQVDCPLPLEDDPLDPEGRLTFDEVVGLMDRRRMLRATDRRKCAGFEPEEIDRLRCAFDGYDRDGSGTLSASEVAPLLQRFGLTMTTKEEQEKIVGEIDRARQRAKAAGVTDLGLQGSGSLPFWVFVQLMRLVYSREDFKTLTRENLAVEETGFARGEVEQFREIFATALRQTQEEAMSRRPGDPWEADTARRKKFAKDFVGPDPPELTVAACYSLLAQLGLRVRTQQREELVGFINNLGNEGCINFPDFLRLMRWMLDGDFAGICGVMSPGSLG